MTHLEKGLAAPTGKPERIAEIVADLPSATVNAPRKLSNSLVRRLAEISETHNGLVPLHGRLFAQWLHHAYPQECSYPYLSGTINPNIPLTYYMKSEGDMKFSADRSEMEAVIEGAKRKPIRDKDDG